MQYKIIYQAINKIMGGMCCCQGMSEDRLTMMLKDALIKCRTQALRPNQDKTINELIAEKTFDKPIMLANYQVVLKQRSHNLGNLHVVRLVVTPRNSTTGKGLIIYHDGFYEGTIIGNAASGEGVLYIYDLVEFEMKRNFAIRGEWEEDNLNRGVVSAIAEEGEAEVEKEQMAAQFINGELFLRFKEGSIESYNGSVDWSRPITLKQWMMNGKGKIVFRNKSVYDGSIKNGLMDTEGGEKATYTSEGEVEIYHGHYKQGLRHGEGTSTVKLEAMKYSYTLTWINGKPDMDSFNLDGRDSRSTMIRSSVFRA